MKEFSLYIRRILALSICSMVFFAAWYKFPSYWYISLPVILLSFAFIIARINGEPPKELFDHSKTATFFNKGGLRELLKLIVHLFGFVYDIIVWEIWGAAQIFIVITDIFYLLKIISFWLVHASIWFLKLFVPFWRLVYFNSIHYLFKWPWWIYRNSFKNVKYAYNKNIFRISLIGSAIALFLIQFAYWVEIASELDGIKYIGLVLALLPIAWVFGEISSIRARDLLNASWIKIKANYENGIESARSLLYFIFVFVILFVIQVSLNVLGWIPKWGITLASITLNINVIISFLLIIIAVTIYFATLVLPTYRLFTVFNERSIVDTWIFLKKSLSNILHYIFFVVPTSFFGIITAIIPIAMVMASLWLTLQIKNNFIEHRISELHKKQVELKDVYKKHVLSKKIDELTLVQKLPTKELLQYMIHKDETDDEIELLHKRIEENNKNLNSQQVATKAKIDTLQAIVKQQKSRPFPKESYIIQLETQIKRVGNELDLTKINIAHENKITKIDIDFLLSRNNKLILIFYCVTLLLVVCGSAILASFLGYLGNVLYDVYVFRNDNSSSYIYKKSSTYIIHTIREEKNKNHNQPLLSTTLNALLFLIIFIIIGSI